MKPRVAFLTTHPIQYQVPVFRLLSQREDLELEVLFCQIPDAEQQGAEFGVAFQWDVPLLDGYPFHVLDNVAGQPSVTAFNGCDTPGLTRLFRQRGYDVVVINGWVVKSCLQGLRACRRLGIPCLVRGEANDLRARPWWKRSLQKRLVQRYSRCLAIGKANHDFYRARGVPESQLDWAPYCIENDRFSAAADQRASRRPGLRKRFGIAEDATCFLFSGKLIEKKHPVELLRAAAGAAARGARLHILMVGDGPLRGACEALLSDTAATLPVTMTGFLNQSEIVDAYVASDCLVLPSDAGETWGLVTNEAMACGRPALVSDLAGCHPDLITAQTGEVIPFGDWDAWGAALRRWSQDSKRLAALGRTARQHIESYTPQIATDGIAAAVAKVTLPRRTRSRVEVGG